MVTTIAGRYEVQETIGVGGMGTVMKARDDILHRDVAIKLLKEEIHNDPPARERFQREARIAASLSHHGIAQVYDFAEDGERTFIVMELLDGRDLSQILEDQGRLDPERAAQIVADTAEALDYAHEAGAVHRDVKPANIFVTSKGQVKVTDFGIALAAGLSTVTRTGDIVGTPFYLSPEQVRGEQATPRSDIYSLGCVLYQLLTGSTPYAKESSVATAMSHTREPIPDPRESSEAIPDGLAAVCMKAMAKEPNDRFETALSMAEAIRTLSADVATRDSSGTTQVLERPSEPRVMERLQRADRGRRRALVAVIAAAILIGLLAAAARMTSGTQTRVPDFTGQSFESAEAAAKEIGFVVSRQDRVSQKQGGSVVGQQPSEGERVPKGSELILFVSTGNGVTVPNVNNLPISEAEDTLRGMGFKPEVVRQSDGEPGGLVIEQDPPPGSLAPAGSTVKLTINKIEEDKKGRGKGGGDDD